MKDNCNSNIFVITTCRPTTNPEQFLNQNLLVRQCIEQKIKLILVNKSSQIPAEITSYQNIILNTQYEGQRPNLGELTRLDGESHKLICNSDIFFESEFLTKFNKILELTNMSMSGRRYDINSKIDFNINHKLEDLTSFGYLQSTRTLDYFLINK